MSNKFVADSFETLGGGVKNVAGQVKQIVRQMGDDVVENVGLKPPASGTDEQKGQQQQTNQDDQIKKMDVKSKTLARKRYKEIREEIKQLQGKRAGEMVKYHQPGFTNEEKQKNQIKQLEEKPSFAKATDGKNELPPLPVQRASKKTEMLRGVSG